MSRLDNHEAKKAKKAAREQGEYATRSRCMHMGLQAFLPNLYDSRCLRGLVSFIISINIWCEVHRKEAKATRALLQFLPPIQSHLLQSPIIFGPTIDSHPFHLVMFLFFHSNASLLRRCRPRPFGTVLHDRTSSSACETRMQGATQSRPYFSVGHSANLSCR